MTKGFNGTTAITPLIQTSLLSLTKVNIATGAIASTATRPLSLIVAYTGTAAELATGFNHVFYDYRAVANLYTQATRLDYVRDATATQGGAGVDSLLALASQFAASLTNEFDNIDLIGAVVSAAKTVTDFRHIHLHDGSGAGAITTQYGLYIDALAKGGTNYAIYTNAGTVHLGGQIELADAINIAVNTTTGTKIGTAATQKLAFWGAAPVVAQAQAALTGTPQAGTFATGSVTLAQLAGVVMNMIAAGRLYGMYV